MTPGRFLMQNQIMTDSSSVDVSFLESGIYVVRVTDDNQIVTRKFLKH